MILRESCGNPPLLKNVFCPFLESYFSCSLQQVVTSGGQQRWYRLLNITLMETRFIFFFLFPVGHQSLYTIESSSMSRLWLDDQHHCELSVLCPLVGDLRSYKLLSQKRMPAWSLVISLFSPSISFFMTKQWGCLPFGKLLSWRRTCPFNCVRPQTSLQSFLSTLTPCQSHKAP